WTLARLSVVGDVVGAIVRDTDAITTATARLSSALEREDDALLLALADAARARDALPLDRKRTNQAFDGLASLLHTADERHAIGELRRELGEYRKSADRIADLSGEPDALLRYHRDANPLLRRTLLGIGRIRDQAFSRTQIAAAAARDAVGHAHQVVLLIAIAAFVVSVLV